MKTLVLATTLLSFGLTACVNLCLADVHNSTKGPKVKINKKEFWREKMKPFKSIEFLDENGTVLKKVVITGKVEDEANPGNYFETNAITSRNEEFIVITETALIKNTEEAGYNTGFSFANKHDISMYDMEGNLLFNKQGSDFEPIAVSENGESIVCLNPGLDLMEGVSREVAENPPKFKITVFSKKGGPVYYAEEDHIVPNAIEVSPSGNWLAYQYSNIGGQDRIKLINLTKGKEEADIERKSVNFSFITDEGNIAVINYPSIKMPDGSWATDWDNPKVTVTYEIRGGGEQ